MPKAEYNSAYVKIQGTNLRAENVKSRVMYPIGYSVKDILGLDDGKHFIKFSRLQLSN